jgi:mono/diheme cytochrome c family protein
MSWRFLRALCTLAVFGALAYCQSVEAGRKMEQNECSACHSLRLIESQRLSATAWGKEVNKMAGWGATVSDRQTLIDYLASQYSDAKPVPTPPLSGNGVAK